MKYFGRDQFRELMATFATNKLRTVLTGFAVGWGILLLVVLLSAGRGISNGIYASVASEGLNNAAVDLSFGYLSKPHNGLPQYYEPAYTRADAEYIYERNRDVINTYAPYSQAYQIPMEANSRTENGSIVGVVDRVAEIQHFKLIDSRSRFINQRDEVERRKVVVLPDSRARNLFDNEEHALGKNVSIKQIIFTVVGIYKGSRGEYSPSYIPLSTMQTLGIGKHWKAAHTIDGIDMLCPSIQTEKQVQTLKDKITRQFATRKGFSPLDETAIELDARSTMLSSMNSVFTGIDTFLWIIGLSILTIGVVGVVNIMQIAVTERKREIGIRKALGARPRDIIMMILTESVIVTLISGLIGLSVGVGIMHVVDGIFSRQGVGTISNFGAQMSLFLHPMITLSIATGALVVMILGGLLAGYLPARKAIKIPTVEAMRH